MNGWNVEEKLLKKVALNFSCFSFIGSLILWCFFQKSIGSFQFVVKLFWLPTLNLNFTLGIDGISIFFIILIIFVLIGGFKTAESFFNEGKLDTTIALVDACLANRKYLRWRVSLRNKVEIYRLAAIAYFLDYQPLYLGHFGFWLVI